jgi:hypothetical protein
VSEHKSERLQDRHYAEHYARRPARRIGQRADKIRVRHIVYVGYEHTDSRRYAQRDNELRYGSLRHFYILLLTFADFCRFQAITVRFFDVFSRYL